MDFKEGDVVEFEYTRGRAREMDPQSIKIALELCARCGCVQFEILRVRNLEEDERGGVGHHQFVYLRETRSNYRMPVVNTCGDPQSFSGAHFVLANPE